MLRRGGYSAAPHFCCAGHFRFHSQGLNRAGWAAKSS
ncbi:hypothetical protein BACCAP_04441 [Pseudoflavonifractor capillosus ATCC 29799]|uniref:Uncharacterized protein n=1 Tax=Pseudoflavonifractor capillosus ATCC 29799 TaxID=411467 RepID=A6P1R9_9FIRM|nr:hypothetical protein BACCAP_04441 [Pseudoflavonifractor capillosus ATCC 29799]